MMKLFYKAICLLCISALLFSAVPAAAAQTTPTLYFTDSTVTVGNSASYCYMKLSNAESISAMDYIITYNSDNLRLTDIREVGFTSQSDVTVSVNSSEPGIIHVTLVSQNGINGSDYMHLMYFSAASDAKPGKYPISVLVNDICNSSFETVEAEKKSGTVTVKEKSQTVKNISFSDTLSRSAVTVGDEIEYEVKAGYLNGLSAGTFDIAYDDTKLKVGEAVICDALKNTVSDVNTSIGGLVKISFASDKEIVSYAKIATVRFISIDSGKAEISFKPCDLFDYNFDGMTGNSLKREITINEPEVIVDNPNLEIIPPESIPSDREFAVSVELEGNSGVRAGDFTIEYDKKVLSCIDVTSSEVEGVWITSDKNFADGQIRFSLMSNEELTENTVIMSITFKPTENIDSKSKITVWGENVCDVNFDETIMEYIGAEICTFRPKYTVNFYDADGETLLLTQNVMSGDSAVPPQTDKIRKYDTAEHLKFSGWNKEYSEIFDNTDITAVYSREVHTSVVKPGYAPGCDLPGLTDEIYCVICSEVLKPAEIIQPVGARIEAKSESDGALTISGAISDNSAADGIVLAGVYGNDQLIKVYDITGQDQNNINLKIEGVLGADKVKIFRLESILSMKPTHDDIEVEVMR